MSAQPTPGGPCGRENRRWSGDLRQEEAQRGVHRDWPGKGQLRREHLRPAQAQQQRPRGQRVRREVEGLMGRPDPVTDGRRGSDLGCLGWLFVVFAVVMVLGGLSALGGGDRKSVVEGKSVSVRVDLGGRRIIQNKKRQHTLELPPLNTYEQTA